MAQVGKVIRNILIIIWFVIAVFVTACLLSYNEFKVSTFGKTSLVIIDNDEMEPDYFEGDLLLIKRVSDSITILQKIVIQLFIQMRLRKKIL